MTVIGKLATSLNRRDEIPNQKLAKEIVDKKDKNGIKELIDNLTNKNEGIQNDCIKVLYEIGAIKPALIADYIQTFILLLDSKNNRLQWGAMTALYTITKENPKTVFSSLPKIIATSDKGSVITKDNAVNILIELCSVRQYADKTFPLLNEQLLISPTNQLPMYAERTIPIINDKNRKIFIKTLNSRLGDIEKDTKRKRIEKVIKKVAKDN